MRPSHPLLTIAFLLQFLTPGAVAQDLPMVGVEKTSVTLLLVDVPVLDEEGQPIHGLTVKDFKVELDRRPWPVYSVDDFCRPASPSPVAGEPGPSRTGPAAVPGLSEAETAGAAAEVPRYILYFDFSQLQHDGRRRAIDEARRWVSRTRRPGDLVMLAAYATASGYRELTSFTSDGKMLLDALDRAWDDPALNDPFPTLRGVRMLECPPECERNAWSEYEHAVRSRQALENFTEGLSLIEGPKVVIYFHQNGSIHPGRLYRNARVKNHQTMTQQLGAIAAEARAAVYPAFVGNSTDDDAREAVMELGRSLAAYTGGRFNRAFTTLGEMTDEARVRASCIYRIGLLPPDNPRRAPYPLSVRAGERIVSEELRVRVLTERDRWLKEARAALLRPQSATGLTVTASVLPVEAGRESWSLDVQVAFGMDDVTLLPSAGHRAGAWEIGALLTRDGGRESWEMLGTSSIRLPEGLGAGGGPETGSTGIVILHQRRFGSVRPGSYSLAAFVRDASLNVFGGAEAQITLPDPAGGGIAGPVIVAPERRRLVLKLPLDSEMSIETSDASGVAKGPLPLDAFHIAPGDPLLISSWICGEQALSSNNRRFLSLEGKPVARFDGTPAQTTGSCARMDDPVRLAQPGTYGYHLRGTGAADLEFTILGRDPRE